ncbi:hypothetical protein NEIRO03_0601 [Nematocida sp. AWRm78]|nr:hypothetical protein NEIRO02_0534 [Nematocida sp. AWRm79]KAI5182966.1 hypothetical protein NEIRO03_0601 [Nematocida sp. AWRm78]
MGVVVSVPEVSIGIKIVNKKKEEIKTNKNILYLYLCKSNIININRNIKYLRKIKILQICCNKITEIPPEIKELKDLSILYLCKNRITSVPSEIKELKLLQELNLADNQITELPESVKFLNLKVIDISGNLFEEFPTIITEIKTLQSITILRSNIKYASPRILELPYLVDFNFSSPEGVTAVIKPELSLCNIITEYLVNYNGNIKKYLPFSVFKNIFMVKNCYICNKFCFTYKIYTNITVFNKKVPVQYDICHKHTVKMENIQESIQELLFSEEIQLNIPKKEIKTRKNLKNPENVIKISEIRKYLQNNQIHTKNYK